MRTWQLLVLGMLCYFAAALLPAASAQKPANDVLYSRFPAFRIPFQIDTKDHRLGQLQLFVSTDQGRHWLPSGTTPPNQGFFRFQAETDGLYWFTVQTKDLGGRFYPVSLEGARPSLKVYVDTHPPLITLTALPPRGKELGVAWTIKDETLDLSVPGVFSLDYRPANDMAWQPLRADPSATQFYWDPRTEGNVEVRLRARDRAENWGEKKLTLGSNGQATARESDMPDKRPSRASPDPDAPIRMVNNKHFTLNYDVKEVGKSGVSEVDVWYTQDGSTWQKYRTNKCNKETDTQAHYTIDISVTEEGLYGLTLVVRSGVGMSDRPPQVGDKPQLWVEVDTTRPEVQLSNIDVGRGVDKGKMTVSWRATDKNLTGKPITLSYGPDVTGPWTPIVEKLENTGSYVWTIPQDVPYEFYVRAEAVDKAGNSGIAVTPKKIAVDLAQPKAHIVSVEPVVK